MITFTLKPEIKPEQYDFIENYIEKQFKERPCLQVKEAHVTREFHKSGVPHWHVSVRLINLLKMIGSIITIKCMEKQIFQI